MCIEVFDELFITKIIRDQPGEHSGVFVLDVSTVRFQIDE
jgi:succinate dehydrogenase/fumarate reductase flavoprotein subunit